MGKTVASNADRHHSKVRYRNKYALVYIAVRYLGMGSQM